MSLRPLLFSLFLTTCLTPAIGTAHASMLAPEQHVDRNAQGVERNSAQSDPDAAGQDKTPASLPSLKAKLDAARSQTADQDKTVKPVTPEIAASDITPPAITPPATTPAAIIWDKTAPVKAITPSPSAPVQQQVIRYAAAPAAPISDIHSLIFDNAEDRAVATGTKAPATAKTTSVLPDIIAPLVSGMDETINAPSTASPVASSAAPKAETQRFKTPPVKYVERTSEKWITETPSLPPALPLPAAPPPMAATDVPAVEVRKAFRSTPVTSSFRPQPSPSSGSWKSRELPPSGNPQKSGGKNDALCLLQNNFENNLMLVIGYDSFGSGMLAIHYGMDMLDTNRDYDATIQLDDDFKQELSAFSDRPDRLIVPVGKNPGFFSVLQSADALHVAIPGVASTFSLNTLAQGLSGFADCINAIKGPALPPQLQRVAKAAGQGLVHGGGLMPSVPIPPVSSDELNTPRSVSRVPAVPPALAPTPRADGLDAFWQDKTFDMLSRTGTPVHDRSSSDQSLQWRGSHAQQHGLARAFTSGDILDVAMTQLDQMEKSCTGQFTSQIGIPEQSGNAQALLMESKCAVTGDVTVTVWLATQQDRTVTLWQMSAPRDHRGWAFETREKLLSQLARN